MAPKGVLLARHLHGALQTLSRPATRVRVLTYEIALLRHWLVGCPFSPA